MCCAQRLRRKMQSGGGYWAGLGERSNATTAERWGDGGPA